MRVTIRYFAAFRDMTGLAEESVDTAAADVRNLFSEAMQRHDGLQHEPAALVAINDQLCEWSSPVADGDEILFFPPVAGG